MSKLLCENCPRGLTKFPTTPCQIAIRTLEALRSDSKADDEAPGFCPWHVPDASSNFCYWVALDRESPVEDIKRIAELLGMTKKEVESHLQSAIAKIKGLKSERLTDYAQVVLDAVRPADDAIYLQLFDPDCVEEQWEVEEDENGKKTIKRTARINPVDPFGEHTQEGWRSKNKDGTEVIEIGIPKDVEGSIPTTRKYVRKKESLKYNCAGFSGNCARHYKGDKTQLYALSQNWYKNAKKFAEAGTPIVMTEYSLHTKTKEEPQKT